MNNDLPELLTFTQVAIVLGIKSTSVSRYTRREDNPLPMLYLNPDGKKSPRVRKSDLIEWMKCLEDPRRDI